VLYQRRVKKPENDAVRVEKAVQDNLDLKRTYASIQNAESSLQNAKFSREDAHNSPILSTAIIGFTVITITFAPMAFLTALFALKIQDFEKLYISRSEGVYSSGKLTGIFSTFRCPLIKSI
jgi:hypothetical protein